MTGELDRPFADAIVVAAGASSRMGSIDKLLVEVGGRPLLAWTLEAFAEASDVAQVVVVTAEDRVATLRSASWLPPIVSQIVAGGPRRQESVHNGVVAIAEAAGDGGTGADRVVLVHDGARPLVSSALVSAVARAAAAHGAAIPVLPVGDTIKRLDPSGTVTGAGDRATLAAAQTPQGARRDLLLSAYLLFPANGPETFTDEAALLEACRIPVHAIPGEQRNVKVTVAADLERVSAIVAPPPSRFGIGMDSHVFGPGSPLALGGLMIEGGPRLSGHSDGDVVLHALADALLGAAGLGDLGRQFPAGPETPRGVASSELLAEVLRHVRTAGYDPATVDLTVVAARPRLAAWLDPIRDRIAELLGLPRSAVNVKASTGNLVGAEGAGRGMAAQAIVSLSARR